MKSIFRTALALAPILTALASMPTNAGPVRDGYVYDGCENGKGGYECVTVYIRFVDYDSHEGFGATGSSSTMLDRVELYLDSDCTTTNGKRITDKFTLVVSSAHTSFLRHWVVPKNCSYKAHARHHKTIGKDDIYRFSLPDQKKKTNCNIYNLNGSKLVNPADAGFMNDLQACDLPIPK